MGAKMSKARLLDKGGAVVKAISYNKSMGNLICESAICSCVLNHVPSFPRELTDRTIIVDAHFRKAKGSDHVPNCRFSTNRYINKLVALSKPLDGNQSIFESINNGHIDYRLHIATEAFDVLREIQYTDNFKIDGVFKEARYIKSKRVLRPYLRRAKALLALAGRIDDTEELGRLITISHNGLKIPWKNFLFYPEDYERLARLFLQGAIEHPIAIVVQATKLFRPTIEKSSFLVSCWFERGKRRGVEFNIQPRLYCRDEMIALRLMKNKWSLVCAIPQFKDAVFRKGENSNEQKRPFAYVNFNILSLNQICQFSPGKAPRR